MNGLYTEGTALVPKILVFHIKKYQYWVNDINGRLVIELHSENRLYERNRL